MRRLAGEGEQLAAIALDVLARKNLFVRKPPRHERKEAADIEVRQELIGDAARRRQAVFLEQRKALEQLGGDVGFKDLENALIPVAAEDGAIGGLPVEQVVDDLVQRLGIERDRVGVRPDRRQAIQKFLL